MRLIRDLNPESQKMLERIYRASRPSSSKRASEMYTLKFSGNHDRRIERNIWSYEKDHL